MPEYCNPALRLSLNPIRKPDHEVGILGWLYNGIVVWAAWHVARPET